MTTITHTERSLVTHETDIAFGPLGEHLGDKAKSWSRSYSMTNVDDKAARDFWGKPLPVGGMITADWEARYTGDIVDRGLEQMFDTVKPQPLFVADTGAITGQSAIALVLTPETASSSAPSDGVQQRSYGGSRTRTVRGVMGDGRNTSKNVFRDFSSGVWQTAQTANAREVVVIPPNNVTGGSTGQGRVAAGEDICAVFSYRKLTGASSSTATASKLVDFVGNTSPEVMTFESSLYKGGFSITLDDTDGIADYISQVNAMAENNNFPMRWSHESGTTIRITYYDAFGALTISGPLAQTLAGAAGIVYPGGPLVTLQTRDAANNAKTLAGPFQMWPASDTPRHIVGVGKAETSIYPYVHVPTNQTFSFEYTTLFFGGD